MARLGLAFLLALSLGLVWEAPASPKPLAIDVGGLERDLYTDRYALLIGASEYKNGWSPLPTVPDELRDLEVVLKDQGFQVFNLRNPDREKLSNGIRNFFLDHDKPGDAVLVVFAGHGWRDLANGKSYILPVEAPLPEENRPKLMQSAIGMAELRLYAAGSGARHKLFVLDSCYSGDIFEGRGQTTPAMTITKFSDVAKRGSQAYASTSPEQRGDVKSVFMPLFIAAITGDADADKNGLVSMTEVRAWQFNQSSEQLPQLGTLENGLLGDFIFKPTGDEAPAHPEDLFRRGWDLEQREDALSKEAASVLYEKAALLQEYRAMTNLGRMHSTGAFPGAVPTKAAEYYGPAATAGVPEAQYNLGVLYERGQGVAQDDAKAAELYLDAAEQGYPPAENNLAQLHLTGKGVAKSELEAARLFQLAAESGYPLAQYNLGVLFQNGIGVGQSDKQAIHWYQEAASKGISDAKNNLASMYFEGKGVTRNPSEAKKLYTEAAVDLDFARVNLRVLEKALEE